MNTDFRCPSHLHATQLQTQRTNLGQALQAHRLLHRLPGWLRHRRLSLDLSSEPCKDSPEGG